MEKRMRKLKGLAKDCPQPFFEGPADAPLTFVAWGSTVGAVRDAMGILHEKGKATNLLRFPTLFPLDAHVVHSVLAKTHKTLLVEGNYTGQFARLLRSETGVELPHQYLKYDGEPFYPERIVERAGNAPRVSGRCRLSTAACLRSRCSAITGRTGKPQT